jgi:hypothetical protein
MTIEPFDMHIDSEAFSEVDYARSPGLHLSQIIADLNEVRGGPKYSEMNPRTRQLYFATGFIWERLVKQIFQDTALKVFEHRLVRPGEFYLDGIAMSPDALDTEDWAIEEYKATFGSSIYPIDDSRYWTWLVQMKCYCKAVGSRSARLRVWFVGGDWKGSGPQVKGWLFHFDDRENEETWQMVLNHAKWKGWLQ